MDWLILIAVTVVYWLIALKRMPVYFHRIDAYHREHFPYSYKEHGMINEAAFSTFCLMAFWPYYEVSCWIRNYIIKAVTTELRKEKDDI